MQGALILLIANLAVKVIGALFKIPLQHLIGDDGMAIFNQAYQIYTALFVISTAGVPVALSKLISESNALGRTREVGRLIRIAACLFLTIGVLCTAGMFFGAEQLAAAIGNPPAAAAMRVIAPSVALVCLVAIVRGYFQGMSNMVPTAVSQVIEAICKLGIGYCAAYWAIAQGYDLPMVAAFAISGVTVGELLAAVYMLLRAAFARRPQTELNDYCRSNKVLLKTIILIAVPITITSAITSVTTLIDTALVMRRLQAGGLALEEANLLFGAYTTKAFTLFNLPQTLITALSVALLPSISSACARQNFTQASRTMGSAMRIAMLIALPCATGFLTLSQPVIALLFRGDTAVSGRLLQILAFAVPFVALVGLTNSILQATGRVHIPVLAMCCGAAVKLTCNWILVSNPAIGIYGAPVGTLLCYLTITCINLTCLRRQLTMPKLDKLLIRPLLACVGLGAAAVIVYRVAQPVLGARIATVGAIAVAAVVYFVLLVALHAFEKEDILLLPAGKRLAKLLRL